MSFIDLMGDDRWSEVDITSRTEAMVASIVSAQEQAILSRKVIAATLGAWTLTAEEMALQAQFTAACATAHSAGVEARSDMTLLDSVLKYEAAERRLQVTPLDPPAGESYGGAAYLLDLAERAAAADMIAGPAGAVLTLVAERRIARAPSEVVEPDVI